MVPLLVVSKLILPPQAVTNFSDKYKPKPAPDSVGRGPWAVLIWKIVSRNSSGIPGP